jgi:hypothetical protein
VSPPGGVAAKYQVPCLTHSNTPVLGTLTLVPLPVFSFRLVHGRRKKTGCRRRIVNKEDLAAEDRKRIRWSRELHPRAGAAAALPHTAHHATSAGRPTHHQPYYGQRAAPTASVQHTLSMRARRDPFQGASLPQFLSRSVPPVYRGRAPTQGPSHHTSTGH